MKGNKYGLLLLVMGMLLFGAPTCFFLVERDNPNDPAGTAYRVSDINVKQAGTDIPSGGSFDFGSVLVNGSRELEFVVENRGAGSLMLNGVPRVAISGSHASSFVVTLDPASTIGPGGSTTFKIIFYAGATTGTRNAAVSIQSDDPAKPIYDFSISGTSTAVAAPEINVVAGTDIPNGGSKDFGPIKLKYSVDVVFTIQNIGTANLNLTGTPRVNISGSDASMFSIFGAQPASPVAPGGSVTFTIRFTPTSMGIASATLNISNNDGDENPYIISITGTGRFNIADTGQTLCYNSSGDTITCNEDTDGYPRQDGFYENKPNARSFTGPTAHYIYTTDYTSKDNVTGLVWKSCAEYLTGSDCQSGWASEKVWSEAQDPCSTLNSRNGGAGYAGRTSWRLPSIVELETLPNYSIVNPAIDDSFFPNTEWSTFSYWSSNALAAYATNAWAVRFNDGQVLAPLVTALHYIRCVADGP